MVKSWCAFVAFAALIASTNGRVVVFEAGSGESLVFTSGDDTHAYRSEPWEGRDGGFSATNLHEGSHGASRVFAPLFHPVNWLLHQVEAVEAAREVMLLDMLMDLSQPSDATSEDPSSLDSLLLGAWRPDVQSRQQAAQLPDFTLIEEFPSRGSLDEQPPWLAASQQLPQQQRPAGDPFGDSPEAMLRHVGCQRFRGAMHDYMQAASQDTVDAAIMASGVHGMEQLAKYNGGDDSDSESSLAYANADPLTVTHLDLEQLLQLRDEMDAEAENSDSGVVRAVEEQYVYDEAPLAVEEESSSVSEVQEGSLLDQLMAAAFGASTEELGLPRSTTEQDLAEAVLYLNQQELYQDHDSYYEDPNTWGDLNTDARSDVVDLISQPFDHRPQEDSRLVVVMGGREDSDAAIEDESADTYSESALQLEEAVEQLAQQQQDAADEDVPRQDGGSRDWSSVINTPFYEASETEIYNGMYDKEYMDTAEDAFVTYMHATEAEASHAANPAASSSSSGRDADVAGQLLISSIISALVGGSSSSSSRSYGSGMAMGSTDSREPEVLSGPYTYSSFLQRPVQQQQARGLDIDGDGAADIDLALFDRDGQLNTPLLTLLALLLAGAATAVWSVHSFMQLRDAMLGRGCGSDHVMVPVMVEHNGKLVRGMVMVPREEVEEDEEWGKGKGKGEVVVEEGLQQQQQQQQQWESGVVVASEYAKLPGGDV